MKKSFIILFTTLSLLFHNCSNNNDPEPITPTAYSVPETEDIIMYKINIGSFSDAGNINGITERLDNIEALGINTIWLMPIHPIGLLNAFGSPYAVRDYFDVNPSLGDLDIMKNLVAEAHSRNIAVMLDWVANHTSWDNSWISEHPERYTQDGSGNIISPPGTSWWDVADLNFDNNEMRLEMIKAMEFWITEVGVDGFRCDAADLVPFDFWQQAISSIENTAERSIIFLAEGTRTDHFEAGFQMNFGWSFYNSIKNIFVSNGNPAALINIHNNEYSIVPEGKRKLRFTTHHDLSNELTPIGVFGEMDAAMAASVAAIFMNGTPLIYSGQEVGVNNPSLYLSGQPIPWNANPDMLSQYTSILQYYKNAAVARKGELSYFTDANVIVFQKVLNSIRMLVLINTRETDELLTVPEDLQGNWENVLTKQAFTLSATLNLSAYEYVILQNL